MSDIPLNTRVLTPHGAGLLVAYSTRMRHSKYLVEYPGGERKLYTREELTIQTATGQQSQVRGTA